MGRLAGILLFVHIAAGSFAFLAAPVAMATRKGGTAHRLAGRCYAWSMAAALVSVPPLVLQRPNPFLLVVALFSGYLVFSGYRALYRKRPDRGHGPGALDRAAAALAAAIAAAMVAWGLTRPMHGGLALAPMLIGFGAILGTFAGRDLWTFQRRFDPGRHRQRWFFDHLTRMLGASIATYTAVAVVNFTMLPPPVRWLGPTAVGGIAIAWTVARYKRRFRHGAKPADLAEIRIAA